MSNVWDDVFGCAKDSHAKATEAGQARANDESFSDSAMHDFGDLFTIPALQNEEQRIEERAYHDQHYKNSLSVRSFADNSGRNENGSNQTASSSGYSKSSYDYSPSTSPKTETKKNGSAFKSIALIFFVFCFVIVYYNRQQLFEQRFAIEEHTSQTRQDIPVTQPSVSMPDPDLSLRETPKVEETQSKLTTVPSETISESPSEAVSPQIPIETSPVSVNYDQPLREMMRIGKYADLYVDENSEYPLSSHRGTSKIEMAIVNFDDKVGYKEILRRLGKMNLRPAELPELLAFNVAYPEPGQTFVSPIIALGSIGSNGVAISVENGVLVRLLKPINVSWRSEWDSHYRFATVHR